MELDSDEGNSACHKMQYHDRKTLTVLNTQRLSGKLCDVKLIVEEKEFSAHRGILAANSSFFLAMFTSEMLEKDKTRVALSSVTRAAMESILEFMYTGQIQIHMANVFELLQASNFLFVDEMKKACCQFLESTVDMENCFTIRMIADAFSCDGLTQTVTQYIDRKFTELAKTETFFKLAKEDIVRFLSSDDIQIENEEQLLEIIKDWINYDPEVRKDYFTQFLKLIRLPLISLPTNEGNLDRDELNQLTVFPKEVSRAGPAGKITARKSCRSVEVIVVAGGCDNSAILDSVCCFVPAEGKWMDLSRMKIPRWRLQMVNLEDKLFAIGGLRDVCVRDPLVPFVEGFSGQKNSWNAIDHQPAVQDVELDSFCAVCTGRGSVLMTGGLDPRTSRCTTHVCSVALKDVPSSVVQLASLNCPRAGHCQVLAGGDVYAIGGSQTPHTHAISDVECYDMDRDVWTFVQPMNEGRQFAAAVSFNDNIFIFGGCDGFNALSSCEVYNTKLNRWQHISPMHCSRMKHSAVVHAGKVYVIGGLTGNRAGPVLKSVECYIPEENRWTEVPDMQSGRFDHQCCVANVSYNLTVPVL